MAQQDPLAGKRKFVTATIRGEGFFANFNNVSYIQPLLGQGVEFDKRVRYSSDEGGHEETCRVGKIAGDKIVFGNGHWCLISSLSAGQEGWLMPLKKT